MPNGETRDIGRQRYVIHKTEVSHCNRCLSAELDLLMPEDYQARPAEMFYICWRCQRVMQVGVGGVPRE